MKEYEQITITGEENLSNYIRGMRRFGWVYIDSNAVGFTDHYVTGAVVNGYGGFVHHNDHHVGVNVRFVRDDSMPHYEEFRDLYEKNKYLQSLDLTEPKSVVSARVLFIIFIVLGFIEIVAGLITLSSTTISLLFLILGFVFVILFGSLLIAQITRLSKAKNKYQKISSEADRLISEINSKTQELSKDKKVVAFLDKLEQSVSK